MTTKTIIRGRACAIIWQANRILLNRFGGDSFWALPGGAVELGEFSSDALVREMREELGISIAVGRLVWVIENLFEYRDTHFTEFGFYYEAAWPAGMVLAEGEFAGRESDQFFRWVSAQEVAALDLRPSGLLASLLRLMEGESPASIGHFTFSGR
jgi:8-oxo-dGTP pyrophosphatase MutT (NUDIX family)